MEIYSKTVNEIRKFNRFYTVTMCFLSSGYLDSDYSIAETRILFEINTHGTCIQSDIVKTLHIDKSYLSRIIQRFCKKGLVEKVKSDDDKRASKITLTEAGKLETTRLIALTNEKILSQLADLSHDECDELCKSLNTVISILGKEEI
ncbi:MAG: MarR family winged helix-turn-helix transcriptional regulator [Lachnospiraceae bacterium]|nr:MarR family winged helix-turn-helix transcriptional regulator [Lachnospiraceae bacterium]